MNSIAMNKVLSSHMLHSWENIPTGPSSTHNHLKCIVELVTAKDYGIH